MITPEQAQQIKVGFTSGTQIREIAKNAGVALSTVERVNRLFIKKGKFNEFLEKSERFHARPNHKPAKQNKPNGNPSPSVIANMRHLKAQGLSGREIGEKLGLGLHVVYYWLAKEGAPQKPEGKQAKLTAKIQTLREEGLTIREVAGKLGIPTGTVSYHLYGQKNGREHHQTKELGNGAANGAASGFNKHVCVGIAFAETERFIGVLSQRLGVPTAFLRPRLSELLGRSPLREPRGDGD